MEKLALSLIIICATGLSVGLLPRISTSTDERQASGWVRHPGTWLLIVIVLIYANQVLFTVYAHRVWHGDVSYIARYLPEGWFALADLSWLVDIFLAPHLLSWSVLRVQAFLELPFILLAYLTTCRWAGAEFFDRAIRLRWYAAASYTVTFCLIEWSLRNPYTNDDLFIRIISGVLTPLVLPLLAAGSTKSTRLLPLVISVGALGVCVLAVYDSALLYNLAYFSDWLPLVGLASVILLVARWWAQRSTKPGPAVRSVVASFGWFLALFFVPALPLRYGLNFGTQLLSLAAGAVVVAAALWLGWPRQLIGILVAGILCGAVVAMGAFMMAGGFPEVRLFAAAVGFIVGGGGICAYLDRRYLRTHLSHKDYDSHINI